ncbi:MAG TPA: hypothetical protein ENI97_11050 [Gammaproteobacteria bacterium]|nr:hypothetical protein [Gammaproteobacteria bacterium]
MNSITQIRNASLIGLAGYLPAKNIDSKTASSLSDYLYTHSALPKAYISYIEQHQILPGSIETNYDGWESKPWFQAWLDRLPEKKRTDPFQGAEERRRVPYDPESLTRSIHPHPMKPSDAEVIAGALALVKAGVGADDIDLVIVSSQVPDRSLPSNASLVQYKLGLKNAGAYSAETCCSSFVTLTQLAFSLVMSGMKNKVLIISSYIDSHVTDRSDYFSVNTGDAAFAAIISNEAESNDYISSSSISDGSRHEGIIFTRRQPGLHRDIDVGADNKQTFTTFYNQEICKRIAAHAEDDLSRVVEKTLSKSRTTVDDIDLLVTHQPVSWAAHAWRKAVGVPEDRFVETFKKYGNIANCSVPANLLEAIERNQVKAGNNVMMASSGAGENHIAVFFKVSEKLLNNCL